MTKPNLEQCRSLDGDDPIVKKIMIKLEEQVTLASEHLGCYSIHEIEQDKVLKKTYDNVSFLEDQLKSYDKTR